MQSSTHPLDSRFPTRTLAAKKLRLVPELHVLCLNQSCGHGSIFQLTTLGWSHDVQPCDCGPVGDVHMLLLKITPVGSLALNSTVCTHGLWYMVRDHLGFGHDGELLKSSLCSQASLHRNKHVVKCISIWRVVLCL